MENVQDFVHGLIRWQSNHGRDFTWRRTSDSYIILVSEMLLKRTQASTVESFVETFLCDYPDIQSLSVSPISKLADALKSVGLQNQRASHMKAAAQMIVCCHSGNIPLDENVLKKLPGVGTYTANAVACFTTGKPLAIIDTNVINVFKRYFSIIPEKNDERRSRNILELAERIITCRPESAVLVNRGLLDYGAWLRTWKEHLCRHCFFTNNQERRANPV